MGEEDGFLEVLLLGREPVLELVLRVLRKVARRDLAPELAHALESAPERRKRLPRRVRIECGRCVVDVILDGLKPHAQEIRGRPLVRDERFESRETGLDTVEEIRFVVVDVDDGVLEPPRGVARAREGAELPHTLATMVRAGFEPHLKVRPPEDRVVDTRVDGDTMDVRVGLLLLASRPKADPGSGVELQGLPRLEPRRDLLGKAIRVGRGSKRLLSQEPRGLMMLAAPFAAGRECDDHVRSNHPDDADEVFEDLLFPPLLECFVDAERVTELVSAREVLLHAVVAVHGHELFGPQDANRFEELGTDLVLPTVAACCRQKRRAKTPTSAQHHEKPGVLIVGVRRRVKKRRARVELPELEGEPRSARVLGDGLELSVYRIQRDQDPETRKGGDRPTFHLALLYNLRA